MGQHKHNPTAVAAERGELPPKPKKLGRREFERQLYARAKAVLAKKTGVPESLMDGPY